MDNSSIKKALLMQLMKVLSEEEMKPFKGDKKKDKEEKGEIEVEVIDLEPACAPGSKGDRLSKLKKLASEE